MDKKEDTTRNIPSVLVIEDDPDVTILLKHRLEQRGCEVRTMPTGFPILRTLQERKPDLIVLDLMLPDVDGLQICRLIKRSEKFADIPVAVLTARGDEARFEALQAGADVFLKKSGFLKSIDTVVARYCAAAA